MSTPIKNQKRAFIEEDIEKQASEYDSMSGERKVAFLNCIKEKITSLEKLSERLKGKGTDKKTERLARHTQLKDELQGMYGGRAQQYDPTAGGSLYPPPGMCNAKSMLQVVDGLHAQIRKVDDEIKSLNKKLAQYPYIASSPHPMIILQPLEDQAMRSGEQMRKRHEILRKIGAAEGEKLIVKEHLQFWETVRPASEEYMQYVNAMFQEKSRLRQQLFTEDGVIEPLW